MLFRSYLNQVLIESVRAIACVIRWTPLAVFPGIYQYVKLTFVPFVVVFDADYSMGTADALERAGKIVKGHWWLTLVVLMISVTPDALVTHWIVGDSNPFFLHSFDIGARSAAALTYLLRLLTAGTITLFINVATCIFMYSIYDSFTKFSEIPLAKES